MSGEEISQRGSEEFAPVVALHALDGDMKLREYVREETGNGVGGVGFVSEWEGPRVVRVVVKNHEVVLKTRETIDGRGP